MLPEHWQGASDHGVAEYNVVYLDNLLGFHEISCVTRIIDTSRVEPGACPHVAATGYQPQRDILVTEFALGDSSKALYDGREPAGVHVLITEILVQVDVPEVPMVARDDPHHVLGLLLQEFDPALSARRQVITIREVEAITEIFLQLVDVLRDIMNHVDLHL